MSREDLSDEAIDTASTSEEDDENGRTCTFESVARRGQHEAFIRNAVDVLLADAVFGASARDSKVVQWSSPKELQLKFDFALRADAATHDDLLKVIKKTIFYSVKTAHPYFVNQLFSALDPYGLVGQWLTDALNPSLYTYEVAPVFTLMEEVVLREMRLIVGFPNGDGDGIFCPGGSIANGYAISCARFKHQPEIKTSGLHALPRLVLFMSRDAHYSVQKLASFMGLGSDNVHQIATDSRGRMCAKHLKQSIQDAISNGDVPFMVSATAGTTVLGAFDPLAEIADICEEFQLWMHVDAAWGGGALLSPALRARMAGIERADSVTWNPHKLLAAPQQCSTLLLRHAGVLKAAHSTDAAYLFQKDKFYDTEYDTGDKHIQCGRRADVFKFWLMWKAKGTHGLRRHVEKLFDNSKFFADSIRGRSGFKLVLDQPECTNVCFWYVPQSLRGLENTEDYKSKLHQVAPKIKERMMREGVMMVTYQPLRELPNFFRIVFQNSMLNHDDMTHLINEFDRLGCNL